MTALDLRAPLSRRSLLASGIAFAAWAHRPRIASAAGSRDPRLVVVVLRGALDGLATVAPISDPHYVRHHGALALSLTGPHPALPLDGQFALNPAMPELARLYKAGQASVVHAVATGYRERSHFDGQDVLESGQAVPGRTESGWLNRALARMPATERVRPIRGLGVGATVPLIMRGPSQVMGWAAPGMPPAGDDLAARVLDLYDNTDTKLAQSLRGGLDTRRMADAGEPMTMGGAKIMPGAMDQPAGMRQAAIGTARLLAAADGPRVAALAFEGWDTHAAEGPLDGALAKRLGGLDTALADLEKGLGAAWADTVVVVVTEFGRTVRINGTNGTDHGTGTLAFLVGGAVRGGRVVTDWPGLADDRLYQNRDLMPTTDLRSVFGGVLADHLGLSPQIVAEVFPDAGAVKPLRGLVV